MLLSHSPSVGLDERVTTGLICEQLSLPIFLRVPVIAKDEHLVSSPQTVKIFWLASLCQAFSPQYEGEISDLPKMLVSLYLIAMRLLLSRAE